MRTKMPQDAPGSLAETEYIDILAFLLAASKFPSGLSELKPDLEDLAGITVIGMGGLKVPDFSLVEVVGCLTQTPGQQWVIAGASEPVRARTPSNSSQAELDAQHSEAAGAGTFGLLEFPTLGREALLGHRVQAKGFLIRQPDGNRLNLTALQSVSKTCP
jgi:hypothetical protein